jgi:hypothetical protein
MLSMKQMQGSSALSAAGGIQAWMQLFDRSAASVNAAAAQTADQPSVSVPGTSPASPDVVDGMVGTQLAATGIRANIAVLKTADEMLGTLLDIRA